MRRSIIDETFIGFGVDFIWLGCMYLLVKVDLFTFVDCWSELKFCKQPIMLTFFFSYGIKNPGYKYGDTMFCRLMNMGIQFFVNYIGLMLKMNGG